MKKTDTSNNQLVTYSNKFNESLNISKLNPVEMNVVMTMFSYVKNNESASVELTFSDLRKQANINYKIGDPEIESLVIGSLQKVGLGSIVFNTPGKFLMFSVFDYVEVDLKSKNIKFKLGEKFISYFNYLIEQYTSFSLLDFVNIKHKYAKNIYRILMQYKNTGHYEHNYADFCYNVIGVPIDAKIKSLSYRYIEPSIKELLELGLFTKLKVSYSRKDRKIDEIVFNFELAPFTRINKDDLVKDGNKVSDEEWKELLEDTMNPASENKDDSDDLPF